MSINTDKTILKEEFLRRSAEFIPNAGQFDSEVNYFAHAKGYDIFFLMDKIVFDFRGKLSSDKKKYSRAAIYLQFDGSNSTTAPKGQNPNEGVRNFYLGDNASRWSNHVSSYQELLYQNIWPKIDLLIKSEMDKIKFYWIIRPGGNPDQIEMHYIGAKSLKLDSDGNLLVRHQLGTMTDECPIAFQEEGESKTTIACNFVISMENKMSVRFQTGYYDKATTLYIDPAVSYSTYLGGSLQDAINAVVVDSTGCAYFVGQTSSTNFPTVAGAYQGALAGTTNVFVTKIAANGTSLIYSTYLGGSGIDIGLAIDIDPSGSAYVTGSTTSANFPTVDPYQASLAGTQAAFVSKLSPNGGALTYSTYLGGAAGTTTGYGIGVNGFGQVFVAGETSSASFPTTAGAFDRTFGGVTDGFVSLIASGGSTLLASTYLGGTAADSVYGLTLDSSDSVYVTGGTSSADFPTTTGAYQIALAGTENAFVTKLVEDLSTLVFSSYLGGAGTDIARGIEIDANNLACVVGSTTSSDFPTTVGAYQTTYGGGTADAFVTKFSLDGGSLIFSTFLGGSLEDLGRAIFVDMTGHIWIAGSTTSANFPTTPTVITSSLTGSQDWFISMLSAAGNLLLVSYYLGGTSTQIVNGMAMDSSGSLYVVGTTTSNDFPVSVGAFQTTYGGGISDGAAIKANFATFNNASLTIMKLVP